MVKNDNEGEEIVLSGTVIDIQPAKGRHPHQKWLVTLQVDSVVAGSFTSKTFSFSIHSPTKSGIAVGGRYTIYLMRNQAGEYLLKNIEVWKQ